MKNTIISILELKEDQQNDKDIINYCTAIDNALVNEDMHKINAYYMGLDLYKSLIKAGYNDKIAAIYAINHGIMRMTQIQHKDEYQETLDLIQADINKDKPK